MPSPMCCTAVTRCWPTVSYTHLITIIAPTPFKKKIEEQKLDPDTKAPMLDAEGKVIMEEREVEICLLYTSRCV